MMNIEFHGKATGGHGITDVSADGSSRVPPCLLTPYTASIQVSCQDPFYKNNNVTALSFVKAVHLQEGCSIRYGSPVSILILILENLFVFRGSSYKYYFYSYQKIQQFWT